MKHLDIIIGIIVTVVVYMFAPDIPIDMPSGKKFVVFIVQCLLSTIVGATAAMLVGNKGD